MLKHHASLNAPHTYHKRMLTAEAHETHIHSNNRKQVLSSMYRWLQTRHKNIQGSEYLGGEYTQGSMIDGLRHENVMDLSFSDESFDRVLSF